MNQFRDLTILAFVVLAISITVSDPDDWNWAAAGGAYVVSGLHYLAIMRPWSIIILMALALALFMTRIKY